MALQEKIMKLSPEQREKLFAVKDEAVLDAFVSEHGIELTAEERSEALVYLNKHEMPLSDEELDNVAGGGSRTPDDTLLGLEPNYKCNFWEGKHAYINGGIGCIDCKHAFKYSIYFYSCTHPDAINFS